MASLPVYDMNGSEVGTYEIDPTEIAKVINKQLLHDVVVMYQANLRQGSRKTKGRSEVAGHKKKMYRQKGTGNARAGMRRTNIRRGGGHAFALSPRDYSYRLPKKAVRAATKMALAGRIQDGEVKVLNSLEMEAPKTSQVAKLLNAIGLGGQTSLLATEEYSPVVYKSARNISGVSVLPVSDLNAYEVLRPKCLVVTRAAMDKLKSGQSVAAE